MNKLTLHDRKSGFVLAEFLIAICIVTAAFAGVYGLMSQSMRIANEMKNETLAAQAAQSEMERIRAMSWNHLNGLGASYTLDSLTTFGLKDLNGGKGEVKVSAVPEDAGGQMLRSVSVRIIWNGRDGRSREVAFATLIAPH